LRVLLPTRHKIGHFGDGHKTKLKPGLVASYDIRPGNGEGLLFWFRHFINLSLSYKTLTHLLTAPDAHGAQLKGSRPTRSRHRLRTGYKATQLLG